MDGVWEVVAFSVLAGFGARIGWGAAQAIGDLIDAFFAGYMRGRAARAKGGPDEA